MIEQLKKVRQHLLTGVSHAIPFIACGGIMIAVSIAMAPMGEEGPVFDHVPIARLINTLGMAAFKLMLPVLAGYIAYAIAGRPGLVPGFVGGFLAGEGKIVAQCLQSSKEEITAGFLGAIVIGLIAGWLVQGIKKIPIPKYIKPVMPILIIPIVSSSVVGVLMIYVIGLPIADLMDSLTSWLAQMNEGDTTIDAVILAMILGAMIAFDMGGPVNKAAFFFGSAMIGKGEYSVMGACAAAICTPPLGLGLATLIRRKLWSTEDHEAGYAALAMGMIGITEGAIPFAASDPLRVIPCIVLGSMTASTIAMLGGVGDHAPHGGPIVLPVIDGRLMYVIAIVSGAVVTAVAINLVKMFTAGSKSASEESK